MKRMFLAVALGAALAVSACSTIGTPWPADPGGPIVSGSQTVLDEKALASAELVYNTAAKSYLVAVRRGALEPGVKATAKAYLEDAYAALLEVRKAYAAGNAKTFGEQVILLTEFAGRAAALVR